MNTLAEWTRVNTEWIPNTELIILFLFTLQTVAFFGRTMQIFPQHTKPAPLSHSLNYATVHPSHQQHHLTVASINLLFIRWIFRRTKNCIEQFARRWVNNLFIANQPSTAYPPPPLPHLRHWHSAPAADNKRQRYKYDVSVRVCECVSTYT